MCFSWQCKGMTHFNQQSLNYKIMSRNIQYITGYSNVVTAYRFVLTIEVINSLFWPRNNGDVYTIHLK